MTVYGKAVLISLAFVMTILIIVTLSMMTGISTQPSRKI